MSVAEPLKEHMKNAALALYIEFGALYERVQELPAHDRAPDSVLRKLKALILRLEKLQCGTIESEKPQLRGGRGKR